MDAVIIRQGELVGRELMAYETTEAIGSVEHLLVDVKHSQVIGLVSKSSGLMGRKQALIWGQIVKIGRDSIVIRTEPEATASAEKEAQLAAAQDMTGLEVWTDGGDHIGRVVDVCLDQATGAVQQYLFALNQVAQSEPESAGAELTEAEPVEADELNGEMKEAEMMISVYAIAPGTVISAGRKRMMIAEEDAKQAQPYEKPLTIKTEPDSTPRWRPEQLPEIPTDFNELVQKGQSFAGRVTEQVKQRAKQFTDEQLANQDFVEGDSLPDITEQLQSKTEQVKQQMQSQLKKAKEKAQDQIGNKRLEDRLGKSSLGRNLGKTLNRFKRKDVEASNPIDVESFEVWEDD